MTEPRLKKLRKERADKGMKRREMYLTEQEWAKVQEMVRKMRKCLISPST